MDEEKRVAEIFGLIEDTARTGRELVTKVFLRDKDSKKNDINFSQYQILEKIVKNPNITQLEIVESLLKNQVYVNKCLKYFEGKKYVTKNFVNKNDKVLTGYSITARGLIPYKVATYTLSQHERKIINSLNEEDLEKTTSYLNNLKSVIKKSMSSMNLGAPAIEENGEE